MSERHSVILASAGSGKTYELAGRYIRLLGAATSPDRILALTFTRKAAGEMLARVFKRLFEGATKADSRKELEALLARPVSEPEARRLALSLLRRVGSTRVQTLDSFLTQAVRSLGPDLGLPPRWRVMDETERELVIDDAVDRLFEAVDVVQLSAVVERLLGEMPLRPYEGVRAAVAKLHEGWLECPDPSRWGIAPRREVAARDAESYAEDLKRLPKPVKKNGDVAEGLARKLAGLVELVERGRWRDLLDETIMQSVLAGKNTYSKVLIPEQHCAVLKLLVHAVQTLAVDELAKQSQASSVVAMEFDRALQLAKQRRGVVAFDDLARLLLSGGAAAEPEWMAFRLDSKIDHVLLDEFQDTSRSQYQCLEPILEEIASQGGERSIFAVGDVKQSLYGWRSAVPDLLPALPERLHLGPAQTRAKSWRSSPAVLDAVNAVFGLIADNPVLERHKRAAQRWAEFFQTHSAAKSELSGEVRIESTSELEKSKEPRNTEEETSETTESDEAGNERAGAAERHHIDQVAARVAEIHREHPEWTIAVLLRTTSNNRLTRYAEALKRTGIDAAEDRGFPLTAEPAVNAVLSLLQLTEHPGDSAAGYHVATSALGPIIGLTEPISAHAHAACAARMRAELAADGLAPLLRRLRLDLTPRLPQLAVSRLVEMERLGHAWDADPAATLPEFIRTVEKSAVVEPTRARISVMTIHHAKGLEFDAVVLPEFNRSWDRIKPRLIIDRGERGERDPLAPVECVTIYPSKELQQADDRLAASVQRYWSWAVREELSCLYVAMTRAIRRLDIMMQPTKTSANQISSAALLRATIWGDAEIAANKALEAQGDLPGGGELLALFRHEGGVAASQHHASATEAEPDRPVVRFDMAVAEGVAPVAPSTKDGGALADRLTFELTRGVHLQAGEVWHYAFETIEWRRDESANQSAALAAAKFRLADAERQRLAEQLGECFAKALGGLLSESRYGERGGRPVVLREWPFAVDGDRAGAAFHGRIDRLVVGVDEAERPIWAEIIDYKVQLVPAGEAAAAEDHRPQMDAYRAAVAAMFKLDAETVRCVVAFPLAGTYAELPRSNPDAHSADKEVRATKRRSDGAKKK